MRGLVLTTLLLVACGTSPPSADHSADASTAGNGGSGYGRAGSDGGGAGGESAGAASGDASTPDSGTPIGCTSPSTYSAYSGTDVRPAPDPPPAVGPVNSTITDPVFGSRILRVTDENTWTKIASYGGNQTYRNASFIPSDSGFFRTWNSDSTAFQFEDAHGQGFWMEFDLHAFKVGDGLSTPTPHPLVSARGAWSAIDPDIMYLLDGPRMVVYNKKTDSKTDLVSSPDGGDLLYTAVVLGPDLWVCSAAGGGVQDTFPDIFCVEPSDPTKTKLIDVPNKTINGVASADPDWPTSASGETLGIHGLYGSAGAARLGVTFHQQSWGGNGDAVFNLATETWSLMRGDATHVYWSGHNTLGNGKFINGSGSQDGVDSRGMLVRDPDDLDNTSKYLFVANPPSQHHQWFDDQHVSWFNSASNPDAPAIASRYTTTVPDFPKIWADEIIGVAVDGSNTVYRFAHNYAAYLKIGYYGSAFAQVSNDGRRALFSSPWGGTLGDSPNSDFGSPQRIDTFIVELAPPCP